MKINIRERIIQLRSVMLDKNLNINEVPHHFREPFIYSGYRNPRSTFSGCLKSLLYPTNETINIWTHLLPAFYFAIIFHEITYQLFSKDQLDLYSPLFLHSGSIVLYTFVSSFAHMLNTMSNFARHTCFIIDYASVSIYAYGTGLAIWSYSVPESWMNDKSHKRKFDTFLIIFAIVCILGMLISTKTRFQKASYRRKILRASAFMIPCFIALVPIFLRSRNCYLKYRFVDDTNDECSKDYWIFSTGQCFFSALGVFLYISHIPEVLYPGKFDILGHSHQWFHIFGALGSLFQIHGTWNDYNLRRSFLLNTFNNYNIIISFLIVCILNFFISLYYILYLRKKYPIKV